MPLQSGSPQQPQQVDRRLRARISMSNEPLRTKGILSADFNSPRLRQVSRAQTGLLDAQVEGGGIASIFKHRPLRTHGLSILLSIHFARMDGRPGALPGRSGRQGLSWAYRFQRTQWSAA